MPVFRFVPAIAALMVCLGGCSNDPLGRHAVAGTVTVDGAPLARGNISFQPTEGQATSGGAVITAGKFSVSKEGGLVAGKYRVSINAPMPGTGGKVDEHSLPGDSPPPPTELIPAEWNSASKHFIELKKQGPFEFPFEITTKCSEIKIVQRAMVFVPS